MAENDEIWFSIIKFTHQTESYLMITNDVSAGEEEISLAFENTVLDGFLFDGPLDWVIPMQKHLDKKLEIHQIDLFDYSSPCYYAEDYNLINKLFRRLLSEFNTAYESID